DVQRLSQPLRKPFDETELAPVGAPADGRRLQVQANAFALRPFDFVDDILAARQLCLDEQVIVGRQEFPVEKIRDLASIHGPDLRTWLDAQFGGDAVRIYSTDANH